MSEPTFNPAWEVLKIYVSTVDLDGNEGREPMIVFAARGRRSGRAYVAAVAFPLDVFDAQKMYEPDAIAEILERLDVAFRISQ